MAVLEVKGFLDQKVIECYNMFIDLVHKYKLMISH